MPAVGRFALNVDAGLATSPARQRGGGTADAPPHCDHFFAMFFDVGRLFATARPASRAIRPSRLLQALDAHVRRAGRRDVFPPLAGVIIAARLAASDPVDGGIPSALAAQTGFDAIAADLRRFGDHR
jgi:hypothetical protein